ERHPPPLHRRPHGQKCRPFLVPFAFQIFAKFSALPFIKRRTLRLNTVNVVIPRHRQPCLVHSTKVHQNRSASKSPLLSPPRATHTRHLEPRAFFAGGALSDITRIFSSPRAHSMPARSATQTHGRMRHEVRSKF